MSEDTCLYCTKTSFYEPLYLIRVEGRTEGVCEACYRTKLRGTHAAVDFGSAPAGEPFARRPSPVPPGPFHVVRNVPVVWRDETPIQFEDQVRTSDEAIADPVAIFEAYQKLRSDLTGSGGAPPEPGPRDRLRERVEKLLEEALRDQIPGPALCARLREVLDAREGA